MTMSGVGGGFGYFREEAALVFRDQDGSIRFFSCQILIAGKPHSQVIQELPSLLGRDFLNLCALTVDRPNNQVLINPAHVANNVILPA